ncbi:5249_t:CDS:1, partial [Gigaspora rosea]
AGIIGLILQKVPAGTTFNESSSDASQRSDVSNVADSNMVHGNGLGKLDGLKNLKTET